MNGILEIVLSANNGYASSGFRPISWMENSYLVVDLFMGIGVCYVIVKTRLDISPEDLFSEFLSLELLSSRLVTHVRIEKFRLHTREVLG